MAETKSTSQLSLILGLALLCPTAPAAQSITEPFLGVRHFTRTETSPRPLKIHVVEVDLRAPGISFQVSPRSASYPGPIINGSVGETNHQTTRAFVNSIGAQVAINGSFYASSSGWANNLGLTVSNGDKYSPWQASSEPEFRDALNISQNNEALILKRATSVPTGFETNPPLVPLYNAVTGRQRLLLNGTNIGPSSCDICGLNPRTAVGLNADNTKLIMMTIDGRQFGTSEGVTLLELANYLSEYSVTNAINLDGGGSTTMVMDLYDDGIPSQVVNTPSDGSERAVGTSLALFALPNVP